jgi:hypothetical protein
MTEIAIGEYIPYTIAILIPENTCNRDVEIVNYQFDMETQSWYYYQAENLNNNIDIEEGLYFDDEKIPSIIETVIFDKCEAQQKVIVWL